MGAQRLSMPRLKDQVKLSPEQLENFKQCFTAIDKDGSGNIDRDEFREFVQEVGMDVTEQELTWMMNDLDADGNGTVDCEEFIAAMKSKFNDVEGEEIIQNAFDVFDLDGSGALSYSEMEEVLVHMGEKMSSDQIRRLIVAADTDASGDIDIDEFSNMVFGKFV